MHTDPVCRMQVEPERAAARAEHKGTTYYFCSQGCHKKFVPNPGKYASAGVPPAGDGSGHHHHG